MQYLSCPLPLPINPKTISKLKRINLLIPDLPNCFNKGRRSYEGARNKYFQKVGPLLVDQLSSIGFFPLIVF